MMDDGQRGGPGAVAVTALAGAVLLFLIAPVIIILIVSFSGADYLSFPPPYLSLRWYQRFLGTPSWRQAIAVSTQVAVLTMLFATVCFFGGVQTLALGVLGEYIWRTFHEVKRRPLWFVEEATFDVERARP